MQTIQHRNLATITKKLTIRSVQIKVLNRYYERIMNHDSGFIIGIAMIFLQKL